MLGSMLGTELSYTLNTGQQHKIYLNDQQNEQKAGQRCSNPPGRPAQTEISCRNQAASSEKLGQQCKLATATVLARHLPV